MGGTVNVSTADAFFTIFPRMSFAVRPSPAEDKNAVAAH
jgi:hypothetical protein